MRLLAAGTTLFILSKHECVKRCREIAPKRSDRKAGDLLPANKAVSRIEDKAKHPTRGNYD
jgi:hypothetical protein